MQSKFRGRDQFKKVYGGADHLSAHRLLQWTELSFNYEAVLIRPQCKVMETAKVRSLKRSSSA